MLVTWFALTLAQAAALDDTIPDALLALERAVDRWQTAHIVWSKTSRGGGSAERFYETRMAAGNWTCTDQGTARGSRITVGGKEHIGYVPQAQLLFFSPTALFVRSDLSTSATRTKDFAKRVVNDVRVIGLSPRFWTGTPEHALYGNPANTRDQHMPREYRTEVVDGLHVVTSIDSDGRGMRWYIDPRKGWNATRIQELEAGKIATETKVTLKKWGDTWFPQLVQGPAMTVRVHAASFDRPEHPKTLSPEDIGIDVGILIGEIGQPPGFWDGNGIISVDDFVAKCKSGELVPGPSCERAWAERRRSEQMYANPLAAATGESAAAATPARRTSVKELDDAFDGLWKAYTQRFVAKYALGEAQTAKARGILKDCQEQGRRYLGKYRSKLEILEGRVRELRAAKADAKQVDAAKRQFAEAAAPLDKIFEERLKPRLDTLPTRTQRAAADK